MRYGELENYKKKYGNCNVPENWTKNKQLARWVFRQRLHYREENLSDKRIKRLEQIGFILSVHEVYWEDMFDTLKKYKITYGDCNVPSEWPENNQFARWVNMQRNNYRSKRSPNSFSKEKIDRLEELGFIWSMESHWEDMFDALKEFKEEHGDCNVPSEWSEDKQLARWVETQRTHYREKTLGEYEMYCLKEVGFEW